MTITQIIGLIVVIILAAVGGFFIAKKSEKHNLVKWIGLFLLVAIALTWIFGYGYYSGSSFYDDYGYAYRIGIADISNLVYYGIYFGLDKIVFLLALGCFYAVLSRSKSYKKLVTSLASLFKRKEILFVVLSSFLITAMTTLYSQTFIVLVFVPFIISVILNMKLDKLTAFCATFGSMLIGILGITYGGEGAIYFNYYLGVEVSTGILYRLLVLVIGFILFNIFNILHVKKVLKGKKLNEIEADPFMVEKADKKSPWWPIAVIFGIVFVLSVLGYITWADAFNITIFEDFHTWLMGLAIGDFAVFSAIFGYLAAAFGSWDLMSFAVVLFVVSIIVALMSKISFSDFITSYLEGAKKMMKLIGICVLVYMVMIAVYIGMSVVTINNVVMSNVSTFNPYLTALMAFISGVFHTDFAFSAYALGSFYTYTFADSITLVHLIFTTTYGFVQLIMPTSMVLMIGLAYLDIDYKTWMKYIWMFAVGMLVILLVLFTVLAYV